ncbi:hypothetical protein D9M69_659570 [compost metagenome]
MLVGRRVEDDLNAMGAQGLADESLVRHRPQHGDEDDVTAVSQLAVDLVESKFVRFQDDQLARTPLRHEPAQFRANGAAAASHQDYLVLNHAFQ